jgi:hypothetical protein
MTEYERLSLRLLSQIAAGISIQVLQGAITTPEARQANAETVVRWQRQLMAALDEVAAAIEQSDGG